MYKKRGLSQLHQSKAGFTLIELLVVIAIIGILSSVVLASLNSARQKGRDARRVSDIKQLQLALELFYDANQSYPTTSLTTLSDSGYIAVIPADPTTNAAYTYQPLLADGTSNCSAATCPTYVLQSVLETGGSAAFNGDVDGSFSSGAIDCTDENLGFCVTR